jgi:Radical SAM superfamily
MYIYQIEVSNVCSLRCSYCPHPTQKRAKGFMAFDTFKQCVTLFRQSENVNSLRLHNFGEVLLHPHLATFLEYAAAQGVECSFFTNGLSMKGVPFSRDEWQTLADHGLKTVDFSAHALSTQEFASIVEGIVTIGRVFDPKTRVLGSWAGQTGAPEVPVAEPCIFERLNAVVILWNGQLSSCCLDVEGGFKAMHISDILSGAQYRFRPIELCNSCASMRHEEQL